jgi:hypothetical protein
MIQVRGPPSDWDIQRYADRLPDMKLMKPEECPPTLRPVGRTPAGAELELVAHSACYRLLLGVVNAARADPDRQAAFDAEHPTEHYTRQQAAAGMPEPMADVARDYGKPAQRPKATAAQMAAAVAVDEGLGAGGRGMARARPEGHA